MDYEKQALAAFEAFQLTGQHVTLDEMQTWAESLDAPTPQAMPKCHAL